MNPGNSPGTQTFENLVWLNSGNYLWEINADTVNGGAKGADAGWGADITNNDSEFVWRKRL